LAQQPPEASVEQHFFAQHGLLQSDEHEPPEVAHELRARDDNAITDIKDRLLIAFFIIIWVVGVWFSIHCLMAAQ